MTQPLVRRGTSTGTAARVVAWTVVCATALAGCSGHTTSPVPGPGAIGAGAASTAPASGTPAEDRPVTTVTTSAAAKPTTSTTTRRSSTSSTTAASRTSSSTTRRTTTAPRTTTSTSGKGGGGGGGGKGGSGVSTSSAGVVWPTGLPFPAGTVLAHNSDPTDWSATLLAPGLQPDVRAKIIGQYQAVGFSLSAGLPDILTKAPYTLRLQVSPRDHRENESYVTLQLSRA